MSITKSIKVTPDTLFQAASISKALTPFAILQFAAKNQLQLDMPANYYLKKWKIPKNKFNKKDPVLIRNLLDMTSGLSVSGFPGYTRTKRLPTPLELLNDLPPSNTPAVCVFYRPGSRYYYSGGAFQVLQQIINELTHEDFNRFMNNSILRSLGMKNSIFEYPLISKKYLPRAVPDFISEPKSKIKGEWRNHACSGACRMWSTPTDLARFLLNITNSYIGSRQEVLIFPSEICFDRHLKYADLRLDRPRTCI